MILLGLLVLRCMIAFNYGIKKDLNFEFNFYCKKEKHFWLTCYVHCLYSKFMWRVGWGINRKGFNFKFSKVKTVTYIPWLCHIFLSDSPYSGTKKKKKPITKKLAAKKKAGAEEEDKLTVSYIVYEFFHEGSCHDKIAKFILINFVMRSAMAFRICFTFKKLISLVACCYPIRSIVCESQCE